MKNEWNKLKTTIKQEKKGIEKKTYANICQIIIK